jgi:Na+/proline symporter
MRTLDWLVLAASVVGIVGYGLYKARGSNTTESYLLAGRTMRWWVIGLSIMATQASAITFIGTTGQGYVDGMRFVQFYFGLPIAMVIIAAFVVPFYFRSGIYTAYEYIEQRFDSKTRTLTSLVFLVQRGLGVGIALYAPAVVLSVIMGWPEWLTIMTMGVLVVTYTVIGGIKAVMWSLRNSCCWRWDSSGPNSRCLIRSASSATRVRM